MSDFLPGRPKQCKTCIFRYDGLRLPAERIREITDYLIKGQQHICHTSSEYACRGGRDIQLKVFCALGIIEEPTDEALNQANNKYLTGGKNYD
jgi:hypothetical protein